MPPPDRVYRPKGIAKRTERSTPAAPYKPWPHVVERHIPWGRAGLLFGLSGGTVQASGTQGAAGAWDILIAAFIPAGVGPGALTAVATSITGTTATLNGSVTPNGAATNAFFEYGTTTSYGTTTANQAEGSGTTPASVAQAITGLTTGTTYHFRVGATNTNGTTYGADQTFVTGEPPTVASESATGITTTEVTFGATINPNGSATAYVFQWGTTAEYGNQSGIAESIGSGSAGVPVSLVVSDLAPGTLYHYRAVATNALGTTTGADETFTTDSLPGSGDLVQEITSAVGTSTTTTLTLPGAVTAGDLLTLTAVNYLSSVAIESISGGGATWERAISAPIGGSAQGTAEIWYGPDASGASDSITITWSAAVTSNGVATLAEWSGIATVSPLDKALAASGSLVTVSAFASQLLTPTYPGELYLTVATTGADDCTIVSPGWTELGAFASDSGGYADAAYLVNPTGYGLESSGSQNSGSGPAWDWVALIAAFIPAILSPLAETTTASSIATTTATVGGTVNPNGADTTYYFQYGLTTEYGSVTTPQDAGSGISVVDVSANLTGLTPGTLYHYRAVASSNRGAVEGADTSFTTTTPAPPVPPQPDAGGATSTQQGDTHSVLYLFTDLGVVPAGQNAFSVIAELPVTDVSFTQIVNGIGPFSGTLNIEDPRVADLAWRTATEPWKTAVWVVIDGQIQYGGPITSRHYTMSAGTVQLRGVDFYGYTSQLLQAYDYSTQWATTPASAGDIAYQVLTDALALESTIPIGITAAPEAPSQYWITATFPATQAQSLNSIITQMQQLGFLVGIDYICKPVLINGVPIPVIQLCYPRAGVSNANNLNLPVIDVSQATEFEYDEDGSSQSNAVIEMLSASGGTTTGYAYAPALAQYWPLLMQVISHAAFSPVAESETVLQAFADSDLATYTYPLTAPVVTLPLFGESISIGSFGIGDDVTLYVPQQSYLPANPRFPDGLNFDFRIVRNDVTISDEGLSTMVLTLNIPPASTPILPPGD